MHSDASPQFLPAHRDPHVPGLSWYVSRDARLAKGSLAKNVRIVFDTPHAQSKKLYVNIFLLIGTLKCADGRTENSKHEVTFRRISSWTKLGCSRDRLSSVSVFRYALELGQ